MEHIIKILLLIFLAITFIQSGLDKIVDWKGNLGWLKGHFSKTIFKNVVPLLVGIILLLECISGVLALAGAIQFATLDSSSLALYAAIISCITLLLLLLGQRVAKDYDGARTIVIYFIPAIFLVYLLQ
ncbi:DoxX family protein [Flagellimonas sp.]|uniref:DoxX family protein n=1 Tax=Flagellimonas sp. TaxID=2058762 RepID=UPI003F4A4F17